MTKRVMRDRGENTSNRIKAHGPKPGMGWLNLSVLHFDTAPIKLPSDVTRGE